MVSKENTSLSIPPFNKNNLLPPYRIDRYEVMDNFHDEYLSPFKCNLLELCERFATTKERVEILKGLYFFRKAMFENNILLGYQWLYGSFTENIEAIEHRSPNDLDVATFYQGAPNTNPEYWKEVFPEFISSKLSKEKYKLDQTAYPILVAPPSHVIHVDIVSDLIQLFTHTREGVWKGILRLELNTPEEDEKAISYLNNLKL